MKKTEANYWENQACEFCEMFGFRLDRTVGTDLSGCIVTTFSVKAGRSTVAYKDRQKTWCSGELPLTVNMNGTGSARWLEKAMENLMKAASGKELIVRSSDKDRKTPYGFTKVRLIRHIKLPEFGSVEELKLKLAVSGEGEP